MVAQVAHLLRERVLGSLGLANRAGKIVSGGSLVSDAIRGNNKPGLVLVAADVSGAIGERINILADVHHIPRLRVMTKDDFGAILGKAPRSAVAVRPGGFVKQLANLIKRYRNFLGEVQVYE
jgi:ribosomal protein L7Ae-like RNA K-turn-binding protein